MIRLLIADDHAEVRRGLVDLFESTDDITVVAVCADGDETMVARTTCDPHVALLDVAMPGMNGLQAAALLRDTCPEIRVLMLSGSTQPDLIEEARRVGALGFMQKGVDPVVLLQHVRTVASGGSLWPLAPLL